MRLGIIGLPGAGKTTVFNALTGSDLTVGIPSGVGLGEIHTAVVDLPDPRLDALSDLYQPKKTTYVKATFSDIGGLRGDAGQAELPGSLLDELAGVDAFLHVLRAFDDPQLPHPLGEVNPERDLDALETEFLVRDMLRIDARRDRLREERQKGAGDPSAIEREAALLDRLSQAVGSEKPLRTIDMTEDEQRSIGGLGLLSRKPLMALINLAEGEGDVRLESEVPQICLQGKLEMEIGQLPPEESEAFQAEYGIQEPILQRVAKVCLKALGRLTYFTVSDPEVRAWTLPKGGTAHQAAGQVHSDMARGFIRAEIIQWEELIALGGLPAARSAGRLRTEGKDYPMTDGEVIYVRFHV